ncbi:MAG TPA: hypothetical protein VLF61_03940 [Rhabdochlamydiaceae bacterium]|nr:hypothetical protein [Rhabdochlamydiaceae bacterium]
MLEKFTDALRSIIPTSSTTVETPAKTQIPSNFEQSTIGEYQIEDGKTTSIVRQIFDVVFGFFHELLMLLKRLFSSKEMKKSLTTLDQTVSEWNLLGKELILYGRNGTIGLKAIHTAEHLEVTQYHWGLKQLIQHKIDQDIGISKKESTAIVFRPGLKWKKEWEKIKGFADYEIKELNLFHGKEGIEIIKKDKSR